jgi:hypothetical protein
MSEAQSSSLGNMDSVLTVGRGAGRGSCFLRCKWSHKRD